MCLLVDGTRATGDQTFRAGQPMPTPPIPSSNAIASGSNLPEIIDPQLLNLSFEEGRYLGVGLDPKVPLVKYILSRYLRY